MAELLVHQHVPVSCILGLGVLNKEMEISVARMIDEAKLQIPVKQKPDWYY